MPKLKFDTLSNFSTICMDALTVLSIWDTAVGQLMLLLLPVMHHKGWALANFIGVLYGVFMIQKVRMDHHLSFFNLPSSLLDNILIVKRWSSDSNRFYFYVCTDTTIMIAGVFKSECAASLWELLCWIVVLCCKVSFTGAVEYLWLYHSEPHHSLV